MNKTSIGRGEVVQRTSLANLKTVDQYRESRQHVFPSDTALRWQIRQHRPELTERGAIVVLRGRLFIHENRFDQIIQEIGSRPMGARARVAA